MLFRVTSLFLLNLGRLPRPTSSPQSHPDKTPRREAEEGVLELSNHYLYTLLTDLSGVPKPVAPPQGRNPYRCYRLLRVGSRLFVFPTRFAAMGVEEEARSSSDGSEDLSVPSSPRLSTSSLPDPATAARPPPPAIEKFHPAVYVV